MRSMDDILSDEPSASAPAVESDSPSEPVTDEAAPAVETKPDAPESEPETGDDGDADEGVDTGPLNAQKLHKALRSQRGETKQEKKLRLAAEKEARELRDQLAKLNAQSQVRPAPVPVQQPQPIQQQLSQEELEAKFWENPAAFMQQHVAQQVASVQQRQVISDLNRSELAARGRYADFDSKAEAFQTFLQSQPPEVAGVLFQRMTNAPDPAEFAYRVGAQVLFSKETSDPAAYRAKLRAEWEQEMAAKSKAPAPQAPPKSLANMRGNGAVASRARTGPRSAEDIYD